MGINAIVWCAGSFGTTYGKTAHGLVRRSYRYHVAAVIDASHAGQDAGEMLDGRPAGIPIVADLASAIAAARLAGTPPTHFVIGVATDGGRLPEEGVAAVRAAIEAGLNVDSGLHDFLGDRVDLVELAAEHRVKLHDVRRTPPRSELHAFTGEIEQVDALRVAVLGTDSAVGKRTTAWELVEAARRAGYTAELIGTGQTAWLQGADYSIMLDSLINDFIAGELEHAVVRAWRERRPQLIVIEGQGSLMNPGYPGGFEILAATRPHAIVMQHAPARREYDGFPGYPIQPLEQQIRLTEELCGRPVVAVTVNHEDLAAVDVPAVCRKITGQTGLPAVDVLLEGADALVEVLRPRLEARRGYVA